MRETKKTTIENKAEDLRILEQLRQGDKKAFVVIVKKYKSFLYYYILKQVRNKEQAEDLLQDIFVKIYENYPKYQDNGNSFSTWMTKVAQNCVLDHFRIQKRDSAALITNQTADEEDYINSIERITDDSGTVEDSILKREKYGKLQLCLNKLTVREKMLVEEFYFANKKTIDISDLTGIKDTTIRGTLRRVIFKLRKMLIED